MSTIDASQLHGELLALFRDELALEVNSVSESLFVDGLLDSLSFVRLLAELEARYGIEVPLGDMEAETFHTIEKIAAYIQRNVPA
jgi:acyl carrier protein